MWEKKFCQLRRHTSLAIAVMVLIAVFFITLFANRLARLEEQVNRIEAYEQEGVEAFFQLALAIDQNSLNVLERAWDDLLEDRERLSDSGMIHLFVNQTFDTVIESAILSIIVARDSDGEVLRVVYQKEAYEAVLKRVDLSSFDLREPLVVLGETGEEKGFGDGNRLFLSGRRLMAPGGTQVYVYVGFEEQVRLKDFISTLETDALQETKRLLFQLMQEMHGFMLTVIVYGILLLGLIRRFNRNLMEAYLEHHEDLLIRPGALGDIAVRKGYLTLGELHQCLAEQERREEK